jgi:hypothetical protein
VVSSRATDRRPFAGFGLPHDMPGSPLRRASVVISVRVIRTRPFARSTSAQRSPSASPRRMPVVARSHHAPAPRAEFAEPLRNRVATMTGAEDPVETVASSAITLDP